MCGQKRRFSYIFVNEPSRGIVPSTFSSSLHMVVKILSFSFRFERFREFNILSVRFRPWTSSSRAENKESVTFPIFLHFNTSAILPKVQFTRQRWQLRAEELDVGRLVNVLLHHERQERGLGSFSVVNATAIGNASISLDHDQEVFDDTFDGVGHVIVE